MATFMKPFDAQAYAVMRIMAGFLFLWHGSQKLIGFPPTEMVPPAFIKYVAGSIELVGGLMVMVGFLAGWAAFLCSGLMAAAYWMAHGLNSFLPITNGGELAALYCFVFLFISTRGSGIWSVDAMNGGD